MGRSFHCGVVDCVGAGRMDDGCVDAGRVGDGCVDAGRVDDGCGGSGRVVDGCVNAGRVVLLRFVTRELALGSDASFEPVNIEQWMVRDTHTKGEPRTPTVIDSVPRTFSQIEM